MKKKKEKTRTLSASEEADILKSLKGAVMAMEMLAHLDVPQEKIGYVALLEEMLGRKLLLPKEGFRTVYIDALTRSLWRRYNAMLEDQGVAIPDSTDSIIYELVRLCASELRENIMPEFSIPPLDEIINRLPELQRQVIRKHFLESPSGKLMSHRKIASDLGIPYWKVSGLIVRGIEELKAASESLSVIWKF